MKKILIWSILLGTQTLLWAQQGANDPSFNPTDLGYNNGPNGAVSSVSVQPDGKFIISGDFIWYKGVDMSYLARIDANGNLDPTFNTGTGPTGPLGGSVWSTALQPDGKIVIGGLFTTYNGSNRNRIARVNADGSLDNTFNVGTGINNRVTKILVQPDGKIIVVGEFTSYNGNSRNRIVRINTDGSVDASFTPGTGANERISNCALQADGKIVICGSFTAYNGVSRIGIARLNANGSLDNTFTVGTGANSYVQVLTSLADGKVCVGGEFTTYNGTACNRIIRLNTDGSLDATFGIGGGANDGVILAIDTLPGGKLLVSGSFLSYAGSPHNSVVRLNGDGSLDTGFNSGNGINGAVMAQYLPTTDQIIARGGFNTYSGKAHYYLARLYADGSLDDTFNRGTGAGHNVNTLTIQADHKILIGGYFTSYNDTICNRLARLTPNGTLDHSFAIGTGFNNYVWATTLQPDSKIIVGGNFTTFDDMAYNRIIRLNTDGSPDMTFDAGTAADNSVFAIVVQPDGKILVGGGFTTFNGAVANNLVRLNADGSPDNTFNTGAGGNGSVLAITLQPDGKIIIGGGFTTWNGTGRNRIARLNADGSLDATFDPGTGADDVVLTSCLQPDGKIIIGGAFWQYNGNTRHHLTRLNADGSLDAGFNTGGTGPNYNVSDIAVRPDGKIFISGGFSYYNGQNKSYMVRLNPTGSLDATFDPGGSSPLYFGQAINSFAINSDGNIIIGGDFVIYNGTGRNHVARILNCLPTAATDVHSACNSYTWINGITYTQSNNTATHTLTNTAGCDSIVTLNLTINHSPTATDVHSACESYTWIDGVTYTQSNNTATHIANASGCDSVITLNLTINHASTATDVQTACESYTWIDGITYIQSNNTATHTIPNAAGCDSTITLNLTLGAVENTLTQNGNELTANATGATYQWINCDSNSIITGATGQSYATTANGSYAVVITQNNCSDSSACTIVSTLGIAENSTTDTWTIFPNPSNSQITVTGLPLHSKLILLNALGETILSRYITNDKTVLDLSTYANGVYFIQINTNQGTSIKKIIRN